MVRFGRVCKWRESTQQKGQTVGRKDLKAVEENSIKKANPSDPDQNNKRWRQKDGEYDPKPIENQ